MSKNSSKTANYFENYSMFENANINILWKFQANIQLFIFDLQQKTILSNTDDA